MKKKIMIINKKILIIKFPSTYLMKKKANLNDDLINKFFGMPAIHCKQIGME